MASEESICFDCKHHGNCDDEEVAVMNGKLIGECSDYQEGE